MLRTRRRTIPTTRTLQPANPNRLAIVSLPIVDNIPEASSRRVATIRPILDDALRIFNFYYYPYRFSLTDLLS